jgi:methyl-accepting chemotaxis protein
MHAVPLPDAEHGSAPMRSLRSSIVLAIGAASILALAAVVWIGSTLLRGYIAEQADTRLATAADQAALVIGRVIVEREREVALLATMPATVDAARAGADRARELGLVGLPLETLERRFDTQRTLGVDPRVRRYLSDRGASLDFAEVLLTDRHGFNAVTTARTSDFVQSDEEWWRRAFRAGSTPSSASFDESAKRISISVAASVRETDTDAPVGVLKVVYGLAPIEEAIARSASGTGALIDLVDEEGNVVATSGDSAGLRALPGFATIRGARGDAFLDYDTGTDRRRAAVRMTNGGTWRVVAHTSESVLAAQLRTALIWVAAIGAGLLVLLLAALGAANVFMNRRISRPAAALAAAAESVAGGDFSVVIASSEADDEIGRLSRAPGKMIAELRRLATAITGSARETATMAVEITAGAEHMASAAQQMADTSGDLSTQSTDMAETIQEMATDAARLVELSAELTAGAHHGVERNQRRRDLARENRARFDASARELDSLVDEVQSSAASVEALAAASGEIKAFVTLVQKMARQSKLLALNAAMEAARAGDQGEGFAVVASEVRRLSASSTEAAERTEKLVVDVLQRIEQSRVSSARSAAVVHSVRDLTRHGLESFTQVEEAVGDTESWTGEIDRAAQTVNVVVADTTRRLDALARGTETFAAAMQEVAASAQQQSASTQQIAAAAGMLSAAAERLSTLVATVRLDEAKAPAAPVPAADDGAAATADAGATDAEPEAPAGLSEDAGALAPA